MQQVRSKMCVALSRLATQTRWFHGESSIWSTTVGTNTCFPAEEQELAKQLVILVYGTAFNEIGSQQEQSKALRASVLESLKYSFIPTLSSTLRLKQDTSKFVAVDVLHRVINECPTGILQELQIQERQRFDIWIESIRSGLHQILTSKTGW